MAYTTSQRYKDLIYDEDSIQEIEILVDNQALDNDYIKSIKYKDNIFENNFFSLGSVISSQIEIEVDNDLLLNYPNGIEEIEVNFKLLISQNNYETIPMKRYVLISQTNNKDKYTKLTFQDYMSKFNNAFFDFSGLVPLTRYELLQNICQYCNITLVNNSIVNGDVIVGVYDNTISLKSWISFITERAGGFAKINRNNQLEIKSFNSLDTITLPSNLVGDYKTNEQKTISKVYYENGVPEVYEAGTDTGVTIYLNGDSPFSCSQSEIDNILSVLNGIQYQTLECKIWGDPSIDTGDILQFGDVKSYAQMEWKFGNGFYGSYKTYLEQSKKNNHIERISTSEKIRKIASKIDEEELKIQTIIEDTDNLESRVLTIEETSESFNIDIVNSRIKNSSDNLQSQIDNTNKELENSNKKINTLEGTITNMNFSFTTNGLNIGSFGTDINSTLDNQGLKIYNLSTLIAIFNKNGAGVDKLIVTKSIQFQNILLMKREITRPDTNQTIDVISGYWLVNLIETLEDLED